MPISYSAATKNLRMTAVLNQIDGGSSPGYVEIGTAGMATVIANVPLAAVSGEVANGELVFFMPRTGQGVSSSIEQAAEARICDGDGVVIIYGLTVGLEPTAPDPAPDIVLDNTFIAPGQAVTLTSISKIVHAM